MKVYSRLKLFSDQGPKTRGYILGEAESLRALSETLRKAADGILGTESVTVFGTDGHDYEILITRKLKEEEWQNLCDPGQVENIKIYDELKSEIVARNK